MPASSLSSCASRARRPASEPSTCVRRARIADSCCERASRSEVALPSIALRTCRVCVCGWGGGVRCGQEGAHAHKNQQSDALAPLVEWTGGQVDWRCLVGCMEPVDEWMDGWTDGVSTYGQVGNGNKKVLPIAPLSLFLSRWFSGFRALVLKCAAAKTQSSYVAPPP
eukprot:291778-Chlamydomonas_euryale.AAC.1